MSEFTPEETILRDICVTSMRMGGIEFDRFINKVKADALREAAEESEQITCEGHGGDDWFPSERVGQVAVWLDVRADRIEGEA